MAGKTRTRFRLYLVVLILIALAGVSYATKFPQFLVIGGGVVLFILASQFSKVLRGVIWLLLGAAALLSLCNAFAGFMGLSQSDMLVVSAGYGAIIAFVIVAVLLVIAYLRSPKSPAVAEDQWRTCPNCLGAGYLYNDRLPCPTCGTSGRVRQA